MPGDGNIDGPCKNGLAFGETQSGPRSAAASLRLTLQTAHRAVC
ncbi:hypothetical protein F7D08_0217 [Bifidobacterium cebidarum]|uniref:Uncharacterized protein n=1 Tax=Bifidobacterium cebidarum TaxID=2650773 RepID=A0A6I1GCL4_9BIFI|nr:hypothetical protein F7D08_0217 [Bifidobacterium cebidarum]